MLGISFDQVTKQYDKLSEPALRAISLMIPPTGIFGILGPNGAGKTTFLRLAAALLRPTAGHVTVGSHDTIREPAKVRHLLGYVPQEYTLYANLTAWEFLDYMALLRRVENRRERIGEVLEIVGLQGVAHRRLKTFSGGMKQRVVLAQAMLHRPPVLLVDEPTTGLDPEERTRFREWLLDYGNRSIVVFSTHIVEDVALVCDRLAVLWQGQLLFNGKPGELIRQTEMKIWRTRTLRTRLQALSIQGRVISSRILEEQPAWVEIRYIREDGMSALEGVEEGEPVQPSLEDAYFYLLKKAGGMP
jgi:ABC-type multidrug transport system ATPase subunit